MSGSALFSSFLIAESSAENVGYLLGAGVVQCLLLAGVVKCYRIAQRETTHSWCVYALMVLLLTWMANGITVLLNRFELVSGAASFVLEFVTPIGALVSVVTAFVALINVALNGGKYTQGWRQAWWALGLGGLMLAVAGVNLSVKAIAMLNTDRVVWSEPTAPLVADSSRSRRFEEYNLSFHLPGAPWVEVDAKQVNPAACLSVLRSRPQVQLMLIAERIGVESAMDTRALVDLNRANLQSSSSGATFSNERPVTFGGVEGVAFSTDTSIQGQAVHYAVWVAQSRGFAYQVFAFGAQRDAAQVESSLEQLCGGIHQIDATAIAHTDDFDPVSEFESATFGYRVGLQGPDWTDWPESDPVTKDFDFAARNVDAIAFEVLPLRLPQVRPDLEVLTKVLLARKGVEYPSDQISLKEPIENGGLSGQVIEVQRRHDGVAIFQRLEVLADAERAFLISGWCPSNDAEKVAGVRTALDQVEILSEYAAGEELTEKQSTAASLVLNELGITAHSANDFANAEKYFGLAAENAPKDEVVLANHIDCLLQLKQTQKAADLLDQRLPELPTAVRLRTLQARIQVEQGKPERAREILEQLFADGHYDENDVLYYVSLAIEAEAFDQAIDTVEQLIVLHPSVQLRRWEAILHSRKGDYARAIELLKKLHEEYAADVGISIDLAETYEASSDFAAAFEISQALVDGRPQDEILLLLHGRILLGLHRYAQAKETFEQALKISPQNSDTRQLIEYVSNVLGQGDNSKIKTPIEAVQMPAQVQSAIREAQRSAKSSDSSIDAEELVRVTGMEFHREQPLKTTVWRRVKIHTVAGVARYGSLAISFDPAMERIFVNRLRVLDAAGKKVADGELDSYYVVDESDSGMASQDQLLNLPVPGLKPGYTLELVVTREELGDADTFPFQEILHSSAVPVGVSALFVRGDVAKLKVKTAAEPMKREDNLLYVAQANPQMYRYEPMQDTIASYLPMVWIADSDATWQDVARKYHSDVEAKFGADDSVRQKAAELTSACRTSMEKIAAIARYVQQTCTYQAIEFGRRARIPNPASQTLQRHYGDCKDHSVLVRELLQAAGIQAHLALVNAAGTVIDEMPSLDQFDHAVVYVPLADETSAEPENGLVIDCTDKTSDVVLTPPVGLADMPLLIIDPERPRLIRTPGYPRDAARVTIYRTIKLQPLADGAESASAEISEQVAIHPFAAPTLRAYFQAYGPTEREDAVRAYLSKNLPYQIDELSIQDLDALNKPLVLKMGYVVPDAFSRVETPSGDHTLVGRLPSPWEANWVQPEEVKRRTSPFRVMLPTRIESTTEVEMPTGYSFPQISQWTGSEQQRFASWASRSKQEGQLLTVEYRVRMGPGHFPASDYDAYVTEMKNALRVFRRPLALQPVSP